MDRLNHQNKYLSKWQSAKGTAWSYLLSASGCALTIPSALYLVLSISDLVPILLTQGLAPAAANTSGLIFGSICLLFGLGFLTRGTSIRKRLRRFKRYDMLLDGHKSYSLNDLAAITAKPLGFVTKDLQKMIGDGLFPDAYIDRQNGRIIIGRHNYTPLVQNQQNHAKLTGEPEIDQVITDGQAYLTKIRRTGAAFGDKRLLEQLRRLDDICEKIFTYIAEHPHKLPEIRKFMNYYLPTTLKLLEAYERFRSQDVKGQNLTMAMQHIENVLSTVITAFEKLLDNLFQDEAFDISAEITVLENMLSQEGLTEDGFTLNSTLSQERTAKHD